RGVEALRGQRLLQADERAQVALARGGGRDVERRRRLAVVEVLEVAHAQDLAVGRLERLDRGVDARTHLVARHGAAGRGEAAGQRAGERERRGVAARLLGEPPLPPRGPRRGGGVPPRRRY